MHSRGLIAICVGAVAGLCTFAPLSGASCQALARRVQPHWAAKLPGSVRGVSAVNDTLAIVSLESADGLAEMDLRSGRTLWFRPLPAWNHSTPVVVGQRVIVSYGRLPVNRPPGGVAAFDLNGNALWRYAASSGMMSTPVVAGQSVFALEGAGCVVKLSAADGRVLARECLGSPFGMTMPRLFNGVLYMGGTEGSFWALDTAGVRPRWRFRSDDFSGYADAPPAAAHGTVIASALFYTRGHTSVGEISFGQLLSAAWTLARHGHVGEIFSQKWDKQFIAGLNPLDGTLKWETLIGTGPHVSRNTSGVPIVSGDHIIVTSPTALVMSRVRAVDGAIGWQVHLSARSRGGALVVPPRVYVAQEDGLLAVYEEAGGTLIGSCRLDSPSTPFTPVEVGGSIVFAAQAPALYAEPITALDRGLRKSEPVGCYAER
jgi:outer membrane protein assembly factor BamB